MRPVVHPLLLAGIDDCFVMTITRLRQSIIGGGKWHPDLRLEVMSLRLK